MECELPNSRIHHFNGVLRHDLEGGRETPVDVSNLLLRGSSVRNTKWILGLVVYTGKDTKLVQNSRCVRVFVSCKQGPGRSHGGLCFVCSQAAASPPF